MLATKVLIPLAMANFASAHFGLEFPEWRANSLSEDENSPYSQYLFPCAGADYGVGNVTDWPLEGGAVKLDLHHPFTYVFVNLGLGKNSSNFNVSLTPEFWNVTSPGQLCVEKLELPGGVELKEGDLASIQVITVGDSGTALYNCADIRFKKGAKGPSNCTSDVEYFEVKDQATLKEQDNSSSSNSNSTSGKEHNAAGVFTVNHAALASVVGLTTLFVAGLGL
ncbi:hypothetical protein BGZ63DRAFT_29220 [Mariannaea sp. PMI_226]|nr:hypothetical protein BGZ63DRAFT_29220 [Mariannaea sp. PMI_226]